MLRVRTPIITYHRRVCVYIQIWAISKVEKRYLSIIIMDLAQYECVCVRYAHMRGPRTLSQKKNMNKHTHHLAEI